MKKNWRHILHEFVDELIPVKIYLGIRTTCRCEIFFKHLKAFITKKNTFQGFLKDVSHFILKKRSDHGNEMKKTYLRIPNSLTINKLLISQSLLTSFAFDYINLILIAGQKINMQRNTYMKNLIIMIGI